MSELQLYGTALTLTPTIMQCRLYHSIYVHDIYVYSSLWGFMVAQLLSWEHCSTRNSPLSHFDRHTHVSTLNGKRGHGDDRPLSPIPCPHACLLWNAPLHFPPLSVLLRQPIKKWLILLNLAGNRTPLFGSVSYLTRVTPKTFHAQSIKNLVKKSWFSV